jgi:hypothetical protein
LPGAIPLGAVHLDSYVICEGRIGVPNMKRSLIVALMLAAGTVAVLEPASAQVVQYGSTPPPPIVPLHPWQGPIVQSPPVPLPEPSNARPWHIMGQHRAGVRAHI